MQTHRDDDAQKWLDSLRSKAERMMAAGESEITAGREREGETPLSEYVRDGVHVRQLPDDEHGILRISIGAAPYQVGETSYLVFRGDRGRCQSLVRRALKALEYGP
ncbi:MAG: hypothetical protein ACREL7_06020 [Longimicrobiales bacterium]